MAEKVPDIKVIDEISYCDEATMNALAKRIRFSPKIEVLVGRNPSRVGEHWLYKRYKNAHSAPSEDE